MINIGRELFATGRFPSRGLFLLSILIVIIADPSGALARVGGGDSFGGGGGGGFDGGGGDDAVIIYILFQIARLLIILTIEHPVIGIPLDIIFVIVVVLYFRHRVKKKRPGIKGATARPARGRQPARSAAVQRAKAIQAAVASLRSEDPNFSRPLFLDFVQLLYTRAHEHRGSGKLDHLAPYIRHKVRQELMALPGMERGKAPLSGVDRIVVGASRIIDIGGKGQSFRRIGVEFETNYRERWGDAAAPGEQTMYCQERWVFRRDQGVLSKGPEAITSFRCPSCGAAAELSPDGTCPYCKNVVDRGGFHWVVEAVQVVQRRPRGRSEMHLGGGAEVGTDLPSVIQAELGSTLRALQARDQAFQIEPFKDHARTVFLALQKAWTEMKWESARAYETDHLFSTHRFWMDQYEAEGLRNVLDRIEIRNVQVVKVEQDAYFDAVTARIHASMLDFVQDPSGKVVSGSARKPREFSEYWTFIRRSGATIAEDARSDQCPSCGAELSVNQAGVCEYCGTKVVTGEFGWVLSAIEQDEVYGG